MDATLTFLTLQFLRAGVNPALHLESKNNSLDMQHICCIIIIYERQTIKKTP